jgi:uncharacterized iron-regulated membrane protein
MFERSGMDFQHLRPILSGLVGGAIAVGLGMWWQRRQPVALRAARQRVFDNHKVEVYLASFLFFAGLMAGLSLHLYAGFKNTDWIPLGLGFGGGLTAAALTLVILPLLAGRSVRQAFIAFAESEQVPPVLIYTVFVAGVLLFGWTLATLAF